MKKNSINLRNYKIQHLKYNKELFNDRIERNKKLNKTVNTTNAGYDYDKQEDPTSLPYMEYIGFLETDQNDVDDFPIGVQTPSGCANQYSPAGWRTQRPVFDKAVCTNCMICWLACPDQAISVGPGEMKGFDYYHCKGCGICAEVCPVNCISMVDEEHAIQAHWNSRQLTPDEQREQDVKDAELAAEQERKKAELKKQILAKLAAKKAAQAAAQAEEKK